MSATLRKFVNRAPRYVLRPTDNQVMRFSTESGPSGVFKTRLINLSETGAAFVVDRSMAPEIGEVIKVEIPVPGLDQIAWFGRVARMEAYSSNSWWSDPDPFADEEKIIVGVHFEGLPSGHRQAIKKGLEEQLLKALKEKRHRQQLYIKHWVLQNSLQFLGYVLLSALSFGLLYYLSRPSDNYDAKRGSPWGQRYEIFKFGN